MGLRINQNIAAMNAYRNLSVNDGMMAKSLEKLSSGFRINRAADDAAGLSISEGLRSQIGGLKVAVRNAQDGVSVVQTAEGALTETHAILQRMRDLAVQAANGGSQDSAAQGAANTEFTQLKGEVDRIANTTKFGSQNLLDGTFGTQPASVTGFDVNNSYTVAAGDNFKIQVDTAGGGSQVTVNLAAGTYTGAAFAGQLENAVKAALSGGNAVDQANASKIHVTSQVVGNGASLTINADLAAGKSFTLAVGTQGTPVADWGLAAASSNSAGAGGTFQVGANNNGSEQIGISISAMTQAGLNLTAVDLSSTAAAQSAITSLDTAIGNVSTTRATLGAYQNRFEHTINNLNVAVENLSASESRIRDTDMAQEMVSFTRSQILSQAGTAMLAQANQAPQSVMQLLRG